MNKPSDSDFRGKAAQFVESSVPSFAGCSCKVEGKKLAAAISRCTGEVYNPEDAATVKLNGSTALMTIDGGPPVHGNPYVAGYISVVHACSDLFASGAMPCFVSSFFQLGEDVDDQTLHGFLTGSRDASAAIGAKIVTGHTIKGAQTVLAFNVIGELVKERSLPKTGARIGDSIYLSKGIGTGLLIRAKALDLLSQEEDEALVKSMILPNLDAMNTALSAEATGVTDVTGFGLIGHLSEMLIGLGANIVTSDVPVLPGVARFIDEIGGSAWTEANLDYARANHLVEVTTDANAILISDPQTSGGLLVTCAQDAGPALISAGFVHIGHVTSSNTISFS